MLQVNRWLLVWSLFGCVAAVRAGGNHDFKLRVGQYGKLAERFMVGHLPETASIDVPFSVRRIRGEGPELIHVAYERVEGDAALWQIQFDDSDVLLGSAPTLSPADSDDDGDVDLIEFGHLQRCFRGDGTRYDPMLGCVAFDLDNDLDVDLVDYAAYRTAVTGPVQIPWRHDRMMRVTVSPEAPEGAMVRLRISAVYADSGESRQVYAYVIKKSYGFALDVGNRPDFTRHRDTKLVFGRFGWFGLTLKIDAADPNSVELLAQPIESSGGFEFEMVNSDFEPQTLYTIAPEGFDPSGMMPPRAPMRLNVTTPEGWPRLSEETITVVAQSADGEASSSVDLKVIKVGGLWTPSDLFGPDGRPHQVRPGGSTTYVLWVTNIVGQPRTFALYPTQGEPTPGWQLSLSQTSVTLDAGEQTEVLATLTAPPDAAPGVASRWEISLTDMQQGFFNAVRVGAQVVSRPKVIYVAGDGFQPEYMYLNARGTGPGSAGDWLMPRVQELIGLSTNYTNARCALPAITDTNHVNALCGTRTGRSGVPTVFFFYYGRDADGATVAVPGDEALLRWGPTGDTVLSAFDVAKQVDPHAFTAICTGKNWIADFFVKEQGGVDLVLNGRTMPFYIDPPQRYVLGDPVTDADAAQDPRLISDFAHWGDSPGQFPEDRWIVEGAMRIIQNEDPDVMYILPAGIDHAQHQMGCSWDPAQWDTRGTETLWDDVNLVNPLATREEVLDVIREFDALVGELMDFLRARGSFDHTYLALLADHGMITQTPPTVDLRPVLEGGGFSFKDDFEIYAGSGFALIYGVAPQDEQAVEALLENAVPTTPGLTQYPWVIMNRQEMQNGIDTHTGLQLARAGELYSEFFVQTETPEPTQQKWPSFYLFLLGDYQHEFTFVQTGEDAVSERLFVGGHAGPDTQHIPTVLHGPNVPAGQVIDTEVSIADITPTLYHLLGWPTPPSAEGTVLPGLGDE